MGNKRNRNCFAANLSLATQSEIWPVEAFIAPGLLRLELEGKRR